MATATVGAPIAGCGAAKPGQRAHTPLALKLPASSSRPCEAPSRDRKEESASPYCVPDKAAPFRDGAYDVGGNSVLERVFLDPPTHTEETQPLDQKVINS